MPDFDTSSGAPIQVPSNVLTEDNTKTVTNKTISGSSNTLTNIPNSALVQITDKAKLEPDIFYKDSDNDVGAHFVDIDEIAEPSTPGTNKSRIYKDVADGAVKVKTDVGAVISLQGGGVSTLNGLSDTNIVSPANGEFLRYDGTDWENVSASPIGEANTASNIGTAGTGVFAQKNALDLEFYKLNPGSAKITIALDVPNNKIDIDAASNVSTNDNAQTFTNKTFDVNGSGNLLRHTTTNQAGDLLKNNGTKFDRLARGTANQFLRMNGSGTDAIWATVTLGEVNTVSNEGGAGVGVYKQKTGVNFELKNINAGSNKVSITDDTGNDEIDIDINEGNLNINNFAGTPTGDIVGHTDTQTLTNKTLSAGSNTITDASAATGDVLRFNGTRFARFARGTALQVLRTNAAGTDVEYASLDSEKVGKHQANGNNSTTVFTIAHGLGSTPAYTFISVANSGTDVIAAKADSDSTDITVTFASAPSTGTNNVVIYWRVVA